jgi:hypothetical protein
MNGKSLYFWWRDKNMRWHRKEAADVRGEVKGQLIGKRLAELGLSLLGTRHGKAGEQYGTPDGARRIAVGARDMMLNYLLAEAEQAHGRWQENSRWSMWKSFSIKQVYENPRRDDFLQNAANWAKEGPTMREVRQRARDDASASPQPDPAAGGYQPRVTGIATGLQKIPTRPVPTSEPAPQPATPGTPATT